MTQLSRAPFGAAPGGEKSEIVTLDNGVLSCSVLTYGAILQALRVPDRKGNPVDVVLGYDTLEEYMTRNGHLGAAVGRFANRIAGGRFTLNGTVYELERNGGTCHRHGGSHGFSERFWTVEEADALHVTLSLDSPDGDAGYPGHMAVRVTYRLDGPALELRYRAVCDKDTIWNFTNHSYFNLAGHGSGSAMDQLIALRAARYTPADRDSIPTGAVAPVEGTPLDLRTPAPIGTRIGEDFDQLVWAKGYDHNFVVDGTPGVLRPAAWAYSAGTGIVMETETDMPAVQFYTANSLGARTGKGGAQYGPRTAFCLETQNYPDAPNHPDFPSCVLRAGQELESVTRYVFSVK